MKKLTALLMIIVMALCVFGACKKAAEDNTNYAAELRIGYYQAGYGKEFMNYWTSEYNKAHPDEQIKFIVDDTVMASSIGTRLENSAELCDIFFSLATDWASWVRSGWVEPLDDLYTMKNDDGTVFADAFTDGMEQYGQLNGERWVIPVSGASATGFVYSQKLFDEQGWEIPQTVDDLYELVDKINQLPCNTDSNPLNDLAPFAWGGQVMSYWNSVVTRWWAQYDGAEKIKAFYDPESAEVYKDRTGLKEALEIFRNLICTGEGEPKNSLQGAMSKNNILMQNDFVQGKAAMLVGVYGVLNETASIIPDDFDMRMFMPYIEEAQKDADGNPINIIICTDFDFMFIPKASTNKDYAKKFLLWISTQDMAAAYLKYTNSLSSFECDTSKVEGLSSLTQSIVENSKDMEIVIGTSDNPLTQSGKIVVWPAGEPYTSMVLKNKTPSEVITEQYQYVASRWPTWTEDAGME